jgi:glycosyltransferase involved in cell wall biosynthesis
MSARRLSAPTERELTMIESVVSPDCHKSDAQHPNVGCRSVLMVGTDLDGMGGVRAVVRGYVDGGLFECYPCIYVASHRAGNVWVKIFTALKAWVRVATLLRKLDAPLVHVQTASRGSFWRKAVVCFMARAAHRPYIVHLHGGGFTRFYERESGPMGRFVIRTTLAHAALVLALSSEWRERLLRISPAARVEVLHNAVAIPDRDRTRRPLENELRLLFLGHLLPDKGVYDLVKAFAQVAGQFPRLKLVLGGVGHIEAVRELASELGVRERVELPGWLGPERKNAALATSTIFLLPSYHEGMPMALLEAMSWGLPVITTPVGGIPQIVTDKINGLLVAPGDVAALAAAIARLLHDPALRELLGNAARTTIETRFSLHEALAKLSGIYQRFGLAVMTAEKHGEPD